MLLGIANNSDREVAERDLMPTEEIRTCEIEGWVDTGAGQVVLPAAVVASLGLPKIGKVGVRFADGRRVERDLHRGLWLRLAGREGVFKAISEPGREDALIGSIVLEDLDLLVGPKNGTVHPRDPEMMLAEIG